MGLFYSDMKHKATDYRATARNTHTTQKLTVARAADFRRDILYTKTGKTILTNIKTYKSLKPDFMKRLRLTAAMLTAVMCANAQIDNAQKVQGDWSVIPAEFTPDGKGYIESEIYEGNWSNPTSLTIEIYDENLNKVKSVNIVRPDDLIGISLRPYDHGCYLTKKLFNNDDNYEYLLAGENGFDIMNEDGSVMQHVTFDNADEVSDADMDLINLSGNFYLVANIEDNYYNQTSYFYRVGTGTSGISRIEAPQLQLNVSPRMAGRNDSFTIQLDGDDSRLRRVTITDTGGKAVWQQTVPAGQTEVNVKAARLSKGINIINVTGSDKAESCKVIVK